MRAIRLTPLNRLRKTLDGHISTGVVVLAGAGVSMVPPTSLPSGDALRDHCVRCLLSDPTSRKVVRLLLHTPAFRAFLPEAVLQLMGSTVGSRLDLFIKKVLSSAAPNVVHKALVGRGYRIFTTNFDTCFGGSGRRQYASPAWLHSPPRHTSKPALPARKDRAAGNKAVRKSGERQGAPGPRILVSRR